MTAYNEFQSAKKPLLIIILVIVWFSFLAYFIWAVNKQIINGIPVGDHPISNTLLIFIGIVIDFIFAFLLFFALMIKLKLNIDNYSIRFSYTPFVSDKIIPFSDIAFAWTTAYKNDPEYKNSKIRILLIKRSYIVFGNKKLNIITHSKRYYQIGLKYDSQVQQLLKEKGFGFPPKSEMYG